MALASSMLVNVAEDAEIRLVSLIVDAAPTGAGSMQSFQEQCNRNIKAGDASALLQTLIESSPSAIQSLLVLDSTEEATAAFSIIAALLQRVQKDQPEAEVELSKSLADLVVNAATTSANTQTITDRKVTLLSVLYNMRSKPEEKCQLLVYMFFLAGTNATSLLHPESVLGKLISVSHTESLAGAVLSTSQYVPPIITLLDSWMIPNHDRRSLFETLVAVLPQTDVRKQQYLLLLTDTYNDTVSVDAKGAISAKDAAIGAIRDPVSLFHQQRNILNKPAIQSLSNTDPVLFGLLQVFQEGKLSDYETYISSKGGEDVVLKPYGLDPVLCKRHMRILSLCSLAAEHEEIPYHEIATTLHLPSDMEVETWVIAAVNSGLLQAKMDQLAQKVMVERCVVRRFDMDKWKDLQTKLSSWKKNVGSILTSLKHSQTIAAAGSATVTTSN